MRRVILSLLSSHHCGWTCFRAPPIPFSSTRKNQTPDRFGMTCTQILKMTSAEWIAHFHENSQAPASDAAAELARAIAVYGKCYDERTDRLAASPREKRQGARESARGISPTLRHPLKDFAAKALADAQPPADSQKTAYVNSLRETVPLPAFIRSTKRKP